jgi:predicted DCC family thiol-disulfide oxidoreductase YuxK
MNVVADSKATRVVFFDGDCVLCNGFVDWLMHKDDEGLFLFASLQGSTATELKAERADFPKSISSIVLWDGSNLYQKSSAVFAILRNLPSPWRQVSIFRFVPRVLRDLVYSMVAHTRYAIWGKVEICRVLTPDQRRRVLP